MGNVNSSESPHARFLVGCPEIPPAPAECEVQVDFDELLVAKHVGLELRDELNATETHEAKWTYVFLYKLPRGAVEDEWLDPSDCVQLVNNLHGDMQCMQDLFQAIRLNILLRPSKWTEKFLARNGVGSLVELLKMYAGTTPALSAEVLRVLFVLTSHPVGIPSMLKATECCSQLRAIFDSASAKVVKARTLKLMGMLCEHSLVAQETVMSAFTTSSSSQGDRPFRTMVTQLRQTPPDIAFQTAVVEFLNMLLCTTSEPARRATLYEDLTSHGLLAVMGEIQAKQDTSSESDTAAMSHLVAQLKVFLSYNNESISTGKKVDTAGSSTESTGIAIAEAFASRSDELDPAVDDADTENQQEEREPYTDQQTSGCTRGTQSHQGANDLDGGATKFGGATNVTVNSTPAGGPHDGHRTTSAGTESTLSKFVLKHKSSTDDPAAAASSLDQIFSQLQLQAQNLDRETSEKLTILLQSLAATLSYEKAGGPQIVDRLNKSFLEEVTNVNENQAKATMDVPHDETLRSSSTASIAHAPQSPDFLTRVSLALFTSSDESAETASPRSAMAVTKPPSTGRSGLFSGFADFSLASLTTPTPLKSSIAKSSRSDFGATNPPASFCGRPADSIPLSGASSHKFSLPFFQSSRKGPGLGVTPACTPIATASVRKDAKRPVFPSIPSPPGKKEETVPLPVTPTSPRPSLPPIQITPAVPVLEPVAELGFEEERSNHAIDAKTQPTMTGADVSKFRKLLSMGASREGVRVKMVQAGIDPDLLDEPQNFTSKPVLIPAVAPSMLMTPTPSDSQTAPDISKFHKLLSMGAPLEAVKEKMRQAGLDPTLLDKKMKFPKVTELSGLAALNPSNHEGEVAAAGPDLSKFKKLLAMGAPLAAVKAKMIQAGMDPEMLDGPEPVGFTSPIRSTMKLVKDDLAYAKFFKLQSMGAPVAAVKAKMRQAGLDANLLDTPDATMPSTSNSFKVGVNGTTDGGSAREALSNMLRSTLTPPGQPPVTTKVKEDPQYTKFFKLLSMGAPVASVKAKILMAGLQPELLDTPEAQMPSVTTTQQVTSVPIKVKDDPSYAKFFKLLSMGAPAESVKAKMQMAGLKPELLDTPESHIPTGGEQPTHQPQVKVKDDPAYTKFFKLLSMGAPPESVKVKMRMAGLQGDLLDTPDALVPNAGNTPSAAASLGTASRRGKLSIAIKPAVKTKTRSFYWQHLKSDAIKGTIWEELEKEHSNQNNQDLLTLTETDLVVLESEFPPPQAHGPGTGSRRGSFLGSPASGPASPVGSPRVVFLIDRARSNNISIIVKQFRMSNAALRSAIMKMDSEVITIERVQGLIKILPTEEEIAAITGFQGDPMTLNGAERILKELISIPRLKQRLAALEAKLQFPGFVRDLQTKVTKIRMATTEITQSAEFKLILLVVLQVGNKMNDGTNRGNAKGFRLVDLTKLAQLKSVDKSVTLLHYVARMVRLKKGNVVRLGDSLGSLYDVQSIAIPEMQGDMARISDITESVNTELAAQRLKNRIEAKEESDAFVEVMTEFVDSAEKSVVTIKKELDETMQFLKDTMLRFDKGSEEEEDGAAIPAASVPSTAFMSGASEFFSVIYEFSMALMKADRENELKRIRDEKRLKQQQCMTPGRMRSKSSMTLLGCRSVSKPEKPPGDNAVGPETPEPPRIKVCAGAGVRAPSRSASMAPLLHNSLNNAPSAESAAPTAPAKTSAATTEPTTRVAEKSKLKQPQPMSITKPPQHFRGASSPVQSKRIELQSTEMPKVDKNAAKPKLKAPPKTAMKVPGKIVKSLSMSSSASPLKNAKGVSPKASASPRKIISTTSVEKSQPKTWPVESTVPFDTSSIVEIRSQLKPKHTPNKTPSLQRASKPEMETDLDDHGNNNSEPGSPENVAPSAGCSVTTTVETTT